MGFGASAGGHRFGMRAQRLMGWTDNSVRPTATSFLQLIAAQSDEHITILRRLTRLIQNHSRLVTLFVTDDAGAIVDALTTDGADPVPTTDVHDLPERLDWTVPYPAGLHARPASRWVETARSFGARIQVRAGQQVADAKNLVSLLQLGLRVGDAVVISAEGRDAGSALLRLKAVINGLTAQEIADAEAAARRAAVPVQGWTPPEAPAAIAGIGAAYRRAWLVVDLAVAVTVAGVRIVTDRVAARAARGRLALAHRRVATRAGRRSANASRRITFVCWPRSFHASGSFAT